MASKPQRVKISGDRNVTISGTLAYPEPVYEDGKVLESDEPFLDQYHSAIVVRPDGTLALKNYPPFKRTDTEDPEEPARDLSEQQKAINRSEQMKGDPKHRKAPIVGA